MPRFLGVSRSGLYNLYNAISSCDIFSGLVKSEKLTVVVHIVRFALEKKRSYTNQICDKN